MEERKEALLKEYKLATQEHVFQYWDTLSSPDHKSLLLDQLESIPVHKLSYYLSAAKTQESSVGNTAEHNQNIQPFSGKVGKNNDEDDDDDYYTCGMEAIQKNKVATILLAGGQGTRLGYDGPKGMYDIGLASGKTLFCLIAQRIVKLRQLAGDNARIPLYIMTSPMNHEATREYFQSNDFFGLPAEDVMFFPQGVLPCLSPTGKILLEKPHACAMAPDGNGGIYPAMDKSGVLSDMIQRGIEHIHTFAIDNSLVRPADPAFIGYCITNKADCGNKVLWKTDPHEKVGVIAERDGKPCVVEYSELSQEMAERRVVHDENNQNDGNPFSSSSFTSKLAFGAANICNHYYHISFLKDSVIPNFGSVFHIAHKKIPVWDEDKQETVTPTTNNNGIKLESFIFDVFPQSQSMAIYEVERRLEFAPVKNAPGSSSDSPDTARAMISSLAKEWLQAAGATLTGDVESDGCEISPLVSYAGEGLDDYKGKEVACPFVIM
jgi:UDP-glucose pyrophosphorylase